MLKILLKPEAENDLEKIFEYTFNNWGLGQAEKYQDDLFYGKKLLANQENLGNHYPFADISYRKLHVNRHLIFYRIERLNCIIIRILLDRMDIKKHLM